MIIIRIVFHVHIPVFRILFALFFIWLGVKIILGGFPSVKDSISDRGNVVFNEANIDASSSDNEYNIVFGKGVIDLRTVALSDIKGDFVTIRVKSIFAGGVIRLNPSIPALVHAESVFGGLQLPDGNSTAFGSYTYRTKNFREGERYIKVDAEVVFGGLQIVE